MRELSLRALSTLEAEPESDEEDTTGQDDRHVDHVKQEKLDSDSSLGTNESDIDSLSDDHVCT